MWVEEAKELKVENKFLGKRKGKEGKRKRKRKEKNKEKMKEKRGKEKKNNLAAASKVIITARKTARDHPRPQVNLQLPSVASELAVSLAGARSLAAVRHCWERF